jgi:hypothetical protein
VGRYSLTTMIPTAVSMHRLVQAVIQARLDHEGERRWPEIAVSLLQASFPNESWEVATWPTCGRLLPQVLAVAGHASSLRSGRWPLADHPTVATYRNNLASVLQALQEGSPERPTSGSLGLFLNAG